MRYYRIVITRATSTSTSATASTVRGSNTLDFNTHPRGVNSYPDPGALHVIFDIPVFTFDQLDGKSYVEIRGVDIYTISQASNLQGASIQVYGGFGKGYDLAKPDQSGLLLIGSVYQAYGNWQGTEMSLNLIVQPYNTPITQENQAYFVWHWAQGTGIKSAITKAINAALPGYKISFNIQQDYSSPHDDLGFYTDVQSFCTAVLNSSLSVNSTTGYGGIQIFLHKQTFYVLDNSTDASPKKIQFEDLVGQPTWLGPASVPKIMFVTQMRADLIVGDVVTMPAFNQNGSQKTLSGYGTIAPTSQDIQTPKDRSLFQGNFFITSVRHIGDSRNPDGTSWITVFEAGKTTEST